ncbi:MAG: hypothetical protein ACOYXU_14855 [Nitrospirota bacterium]
MKRATWILWGLATVLMAGAFALPPPEVNAGEPCCSVAAIDARSGLVTAKETATGKTFQFKVTDKALLKTLKVGAAMNADFDTQKVTIHGGEPCCNIVSPHGAAPSVRPGEPINELR